MQWPPLPVRVCRPLSLPATLATQAAKHYVAATSYVVGGFSGPNSPLRGIRRERALAATIGLVV